MNPPFAKADQASHFLWMCPHTWHNQSNLRKKGITPVDMHLLLLSLEADEHVCTQKRSNANPTKSFSQEQQEY
jgi:hypothetical protein